MASISDIKLRTRLIVLITFVSILLVGVGLIGLIGINSSNKALFGVYNDDLLAINQLNEIRNNQMQIRMELLQARQETDAFEIMGHADKVSKYIFNVDNALKAYLERPLSEEEKKLHDEFAKARMSFGVNGVIPTIDLLQAEKFAAADKLRKEVLDPAYAKASAGIDALIQYQMDAARQEYERVSAEGALIRNISIGSISIGLVLTILLGIFTTRTIGSGVSALAEAANRLSCGDLTARAKLTTGDELGQVARAFNQMADDFTAIIGKIRNSANQVTCAAESQSTAADQVAALSETQTAQAVSVAASIESLNAMVSEIADKARSISQASQDASHMAHEGHRIVSAAVNGIQTVSQTVRESSSMIESLGQRSDQIGEIVKVIKDIADQTNLLALNAAIEAARAGEQGRGFAVVADEVRKLAERTSSATSEISQMISAIQSETASAVSTMEKGNTQVAEGVSLANQAGQSLTQITASVSRVVEMIDSIVASTQEESEATNSITARIEQIAQAARESTSTIAQTSRACHGIQDMAHGLQEEVAHFKL